MKAMNCKTQDCKEFQRHLVPKKEKKNTIQHNNLNKVEKLSPLLEDVSSSHSTTASAPCCHCR